jgi:Flp pilus assembly protein TadD
LPLAVLISVGAAGAQSPEEKGKELKRQGVQYQSRGQLVKAIDMYQRAIDLNAQDASSHNNLGLALKDMDLLDDAEGQLRAAIQLKPEDANYHYNLGIVLMRKSNLVQAEPELQKAIEVKPKDSEFSFRLAQVQMLLGKTDEAEKAIRAAIDLKPTDATYSELLGDILLRQVKTEEALTAYKRAMTIPGARKDGVLINKVEYAGYLLSGRQANTAATTNSAH